MASWQQKFLSGPNIKRRLVAIFGAHVFMGLAVVLMRLSLFGNDPFSCMNLGYSIVSGLTYGECVILFNLALIGPVWFLDKSYVQFGTLVNMFMLGPIADLWFLILGNHPSLVEPTMFIRVLLLILGVLVTTLACAFYMSTRFGMGPYDAIGWIIADRSHGKFKFRSTRVLIDALAVTIGFSCGSIVGLGTLVMACGTGPLINFFSDRLAVPLLYGNKRRNLN